MEGAEGGEFVSGGGVGGFGKAWDTETGGGWLDDWAYVPAMVVGALAQCRLRGSSAWVEDGVAEMKVADRVSSMRINR